jgi:hypothetical protein
MTFSNYRILPLGSQSRIEDIESDKQVELYFTSPRMLPNFNHAIRCFLSCLKELEDFVYKKHEKAQETKLRNRIEEETGKIGNVSVEYRIDAEANWTKGLKYLIINLKFLQKVKN